MRIVLQIFKNFFIRFISFFEYIKNFLILSISLFSILITFLSIELYEGFEIYKNQRNFIIFFLFLILIFTLFYLMLIWNFPRQTGSSKVASKYAVQILFFLSLGAFRLSLVFLEDCKNLNKIEGFTPSFESYDIEIRDIDRSSGDIQEIIFTIDGIGGIGYVDWFETLNIGDLCNITSSMKPPEDFDNFDYVRYLKNKNIYLKASNIQINSCDYKFKLRNLSDSFIWLKRNLRIFREYLSSKIESYLPEPQASLLIGVLFGSERAFSDSFEESLRISGTTHIIAASGYNVTILILVSNKIFSFIKKKYRLILSLVLIWLYCILSGLGASILRATVMGTLTIVSLLFGNVKNIHLLMPLGVFFLMLIDPKILFDIGFQLSILATLGLIYILPSTGNLLKKILKIKGVPQFIEDNFLGTISCTLSTLPISISIFGKISIVSIFSNILVLPLTETTMLYGSIAVLGSFFNNNSLSTILFSIPFVQLKLFEYIVNFFGGLKWGYLDINKTWFGILIGVILFIFCIYLYPINEENYYVKRFKDF
ncbi:MAG: ComEC/Rec2 family competence protein [Candidatus Dojkabacteria bacterium]|nr:ComEC/Rec2 family competence protein [Candidatus Dojkabacteria bacterium]